MSRRESVRLFIRGIWGGVSDKPPALGRPIRGEVKRSEAGGGAEGNGAKQSHKIEGANAWWNMGKGEGSRMLTIGNRGQNQEVGTSGDHMCVRRKRE